MKQRPRIYYSAADKALMWDRWREGESACCAMCFSAARLR